MDARLDPNAMCGLEVGDAHIIRFVKVRITLARQDLRLTFRGDAIRCSNGGGRAADAMRSLIGSQEGELLHEGAKLFPSLC